MITNYSLCLHIFASGCYMSWKLFEILFNSDVLASSSGLVAFSYHFRSFCTSWVARVSVQDSKFSRYMYIQYILSI